MVNNVLQLDNLHLISVLVRQNGLILDRAMCSCSANVVNTMHSIIHVFISTRFMALSKPPCRSDQVERALSAHFQSPVCSNLSPEENTSSLVVKIGCFSVYCSDDTAKKRSASNKPHSQWIPLKAGMRVNGNYQRSKTWQGLKVCARDCMMFLNNIFNT